MPTNAALIEMHLDQMIHETGQAGCITWDQLLAYCIGYYDEITMDHVVAIRNILK